MANEFTGDDEATFEGIVARYESRVARLAFRLLGWRDDVEDIVQDVFVSVFRNLRQFRGDSNLDTWVMSITVNTCRSYRRKRFLRLRVLKHARTDTEAAPDAADDGAVFDQVHRAVRTLPAKFREVIVLRYMEEMSVDEISELLGVSRGAVEVRLSRARERLKDVLSDFALRAER